MEFIPPTEDPLSFEDWERAGIKGMLWGALVGFLATTIIFILIKSYWFFLGILPAAWIGYVVRLPSHASKHPKIGLPTNVLW